MLNKDEFQFAALSILASKGRTGSPELKAAIALQLKASTISELHHATRMSQLQQEGAVSTEIVWRSAANRHIRDYTITDTGFAKCRQLLTVVEARNRDNTGFSFPAVA